MRNLLIAGLAAMSLIAFGACGGDEEETSTKECTSNAECADGKICSADNKCVDGPSVDNNDNGNNGDSGNNGNNGNNGDNGATEAVWTCPEDYYGDDYCDCGCGVLDIDCADDSYESCEVGCEEVGYIDPENPLACVAIEGVGESCDIGFQEQCVGNAVVYCYEDEYGDTYVLAASCVTATCDFIDSVADCFFEEDACAPGDDAIQGCAYYDYFSVEYSCQATESGEYYYYYTDVTGETWEYCDVGCDAATGQCE